jgi:Coenzyme PQQ synthesis protein D (PqqD)
MKGWFLVPCVNWLAASAVNNRASTEIKTIKTESYMKNPRKKTTITTATGGGELDVFDHEHQQAYALNTTSALVLQHCDGRTTPEQLMELVRQNSNVSHAHAEQLTWLALDELGKANLLEAEVARPRPLTSPITRRQMLTTFATAGAALAVVPMVALVTTQAKAQCPPNGTPMTYFLKIREFIAGLIEIPAMPIPTSTPPPRFPNFRTGTTAAKYLAGIADIYMAGSNRSVGRCSASFLCYKNNHRFYTDISNYLSVDNGLIVSWFTPTTLINLEVDSIVNGMVTECIVVAATKIGQNPFYGQTFNLCVSSITSGSEHQIQFQFTQITS